MHMEIGYAVVGVTRDPLVGGIPESGAGVERHRGMEGGYREPEAGYGGWGSGKGMVMVGTPESMAECTGTEGCQTQGHRGRVLDGDHVRRALGMRRCLDATEADHSRWHHGSFVRLLYHAAAPLPRAS